MKTLSSVDHAPASGWARWRWYSRWPVVAQVALFPVMFLSGSRLMGSYRWVQAVVCVLWMVWLVLELNLHPDAPHWRGWSRRRRIITTGWVVMCIAMSLLFFRL